MNWFYRQFGHPRGPLGWLAGLLMAVKNGDRSRWALSLLEPRPGERILEVGHGPGVDLERLAEAVGAEGRVCGVDVSESMHRMAAGRNAAAVAAGRMALHVAGATALPVPDGAFDAVYSVNSAQFWPDLDAGMAEIARVLRPGGRAVVVIQPRARGATDADAERWRDELVRAMRGAGFAQVAGSLGPTRPTAAAAAVGEML